MNIKNRFLLPLLGRLGQYLPFHWQQRVSTLPVIPLYHEVSERPSPYVKHLGTWRSTAQFLIDLAFLLEHYEPVGLEDLLHHKETRKPPFHLTFDDGLISVYDTVAPILKAKGIPATIFVNSAFVDNAGLFFRYKCSLLIEHITHHPSLVMKVNNYLTDHGVNQHWKTFLLAIAYSEKHVLDQLAQWVGLDFNEVMATQPCYLNLSQLKSLQIDGFTIGAHSIDHPRYDQLPLQEQVRQTKESMDFVRTHLNPAPSAFAFPFTDYGVKMAFFNTLSKDLAVDISMGCAGLKEEKLPFHFQRIPFDESEVHAHLLLSATYLYYLLKAPFGKNKTLRF